MRPDDDIRPHLVNDALRRRWWIVCLVAVLLVAATSVGTLLRTNTYTSTTSVFLQPLSGNALDANSTSNGQQITIAMETEASLVTSPRVSSLVSDALGRHVEAGNANVETTVPTNTQIVQISYTGPTPDTARAGARAYAQAFLDFRRERSASSQSAQLEALRKQASEVRDKLRKATADAQKKDAPPEARSQVEIYTTRLSTLQDSIGGAQLGQGSPGFVVSPATQPTKADGLGSLLLIIASALAGLGVGAALAIWAERRDDRIRGESDVDIDGIPVLATVPLAASPRLAADSGDVARDAYRRARIGTLARADKGSVVLVSELDPAGKSVEVATNLCLSLADAGYTAIVVDIEGSTATDLLCLPHEPRLGEALARGAVDFPLPQRAGVKVLAGSSADEPAVRERLAGARARNLLQDIGTQADFVLVAGARAESAELDAIALGCDGQILVVDDRRNTHEQVAAWVERKRWLGTTVLGIISSKDEGRGGLHRRNMPPQRTSSPKKPVESDDDDPSSASSIPLPASGTRR